MAERKANEKAGSTYPNDWNPCINCVPGKFFRENQVPDSCSYVWEIYRMIEGACTASYGAGPTIFDMLLQEHGPQGFLIIVDFLNEIESQKMNILNKKKLADAQKDKQEFETRVRKLRRR